jgi:uncharacterized protein YutE (UPF0331/DUF86 family)
VQRWLKVSERGTLLVRKDLVAARLERFRHYIKTLKAIREFGLEIFKKDVYLHATAERFLHLSIESLLNIGSHIIADLGLKKPDTYSEIFEILADEGVISESLLRELEGMAAFRNILVHDYFHVDLDQVYKILQKKLESMGKLAEAFSILAK